MWSLKRRRTKPRKNYRPVKSVAIAPYLAELHRAGIVAVRSAVNSPPI
jgi:hypothetical protein